MKNEIKKMFGDALMQPVPEDALNDRQFQDWLELLRADIVANNRTENCPSYRAGRKIIAAQKRKL